MQPSSSNRFGDLREIEKRQRAEAAARTAAEATQRQFEAEACRHAALPLSAYDLLRNAEDQQRTEAAKVKQDAEAKATGEKEAAAIAKQTAEEKAAAEVRASEKTALEAQQAAETKVATENKLESDRKDKYVDQLAARSSKMMGEASNSAVANVDVQELHTRELRRINEERKQLEKQHPGNDEKLGQFEQFAEKRLDAIEFPNKYLKDKTPEQIRALAREGFDAERKREEVKPYVNDPSAGQLRPEQAATDTRGFSRGDGRAEAGPAPRGEMTDRKVSKFARDASRPRGDAHSVIEAARAYSAQKSAEKEKGDDGSRNL